MLARRPQRSGLRSISSKRASCSFRPVYQSFHNRFSGRETSISLSATGVATDAATKPKPASTTGEDGAPADRPQSHPSDSEELRNLSWYPPAASRITTGAAGFLTAAGVAAALTLATFLGPPIGADIGPISLPSPLGLQEAHAVSSEQLLFLEAWRAVDRAYVDKDFNGQSWFRVRETFLKKEPFESRAETYDAIRKLLASLDDPFTRFLEPARLTELRRGTQKSSVTGVGLEVTFSEDSGVAGSLLRVVTPAEGGPADRAGVRPGDVILAVDGKPTTGISLYEASDLLQGPPGTSVTLQVRSNGIDGKPSPPRDVNLIRELVVIRPVSYSLCSGVSPSVGLTKKGGGTDGGNALEGSKVGYIRLSTFNSNTYQGVTAALKEAREAGVDGLILDLRNNGGGLFPAGVQVAKLLMSSGDIVLISDSAGVRDIYSADGSGTMDTKTPLSVWVNKGTASASEVLAGALKDNGRGVVVGESTFGKGLIQTVVDLSDGSGLAITVAKYQTPAGVDINRVGITPDIRLPPDQLANSGPAVCEQLAGPNVPRVFG
ncbi:hypothetical protein Vretimale_10517 [Volvox reticuliferus]|uniref:C-terminal processing peptidase n=1 Tax=Volvox reticuliferus TaxID=1737510 RepID=A0A8J4LRC3_9CHLO|nr:hypothetical protein Vretifemale_12460 [Volvox reticuliferus]GIM06110.1 hypothetical protein Vretimale_10517 [Volvox reticuliferus]